MERIWVVLALFLVGCFAGDDGFSGNSERQILRSEAEFVHDEGLEGSIVVDSLRWMPFLPMQGFGGVEFEGVLWQNLGISERRGYGCVTICDFLTRRIFWWMHLFRSGNQSN